MAKSKSMPVDFIDLTVDSPIPRRDNRSAPRCFRRSRQNNNYDLTTVDYLQTEPSYLRIDGVINIDDSIDVNCALLNDNSDNSKEKALPSTCPICLEELSIALEPMATRCGHIYCSKCLQATLKAKKKCPMCRNTISEKTCIRLHF